MDKFVCGYCGKEYDNVEDRMECEKKCRAEILKKEEKEKEAKRNEEMDNDYSNISKLVKERDRLDNQISKAVRSYNKKYDNFGLSINRFFPFAITPFATYLDF